MSNHVDALITCCTNGELGSNYCIGGHGEKKNIEVVEQICSLIDKHSENNFNHNSLIEYVKDRPGHDRRYAIDSSLITKKFNWLPRYSFEKGLEETVLWYLKNQKWCQDTLNEAKYNCNRIGINQ